MSQPRLFPLPSSWLTKEGYRMSMLLWYALLLFPFAAGAESPVTVQKLSVTGIRNCVLLTDGTVQCWGEGNDYSSDSGAAPTYHEKPYILEGIRKAIDVSISWHHGCALIGDGTVKCWGDNHYGQLGDGTTSSSSEPVSVSGLRNAVAISSGGDTSCAVLADGTVKCWGDNGWGQLGVVGMTTNSPVPLAVPGITSATAISVSGNHTCALLTSSKVQCWGNNSSGELGDETTDIPEKPVTVAGITDAVSVAAGGGFTCALLSDGAVKCWGNGYGGELGSGFAPYNMDAAYSLKPIPVTGINDAVFIHAGTFQTCAVIADGTINCWGQLNTGAYSLRTGCAGESPSEEQPVMPISGIENAVAVSADNAFYCALLTDGTVTCWGVYGEMAENDYCMPTSIHFAEPTEPPSMLGLFGQKASLFLQAFAERIFPR